MHHKEKLSSLRSIHCVFWNSPPIASRRNFVSNSGVFAQHSSPSDIVRLISDVEIFLKTRIHNDLQYQGKTGENHGRSASRPCPFKMASEVLPPFLHPQRDLETKTENPTSRPCVHSKWHYCIVSTKCSLTGHFDPK